jgi:hypothetical protein
VSDPTHVPAGAAEDLARGRRSVLAILAGTGGSPQLPTLQAASPLRALPPATEAKLSNRLEAGLSPHGTDHPRRSVVQRVAIPSAVLALLDAVGIGVAAAGGHVVLAILAGVLFVPFAVMAVAAARFAAQDPLRLSGRDRRAIAQAGSWQSQQPWTGPLAYSSERALVVAALAAAERITRSPAWRSTRLDEHRVRLDLAAELDQIDAQAYRIAGIRSQGSVGGLPVTVASPVADQAWDTAVTRVAALTCYADSLDGLAKRQAEAMARDSYPLRDSALMAGSAQDEFAVTDLAALTYFFGAAMFSGPGDGLGL